MQTITFTPKENDKGIYVKHCIPGNIYKCVGGFQGCTDAVDDIGLVFIAVRVDGNILMQEIGSRNHIANQWWKMEELENINISY